MSRKPAMIDVWFMPNCCRIFTLCHIDWRKSQKPHTSNIVGTGGMYCCIVDDGSDGLKKLLIFITGLDAVPALGFVPEPAVTFRHKTDLDSNDATWEFPVANTCTNTIAIPSTLRSYPIFKDRMNAAVDINVFTTEWDSPLLCEIALSSCGIR